MKKMLFRIAKAMIYLFDLIGKLGIHRIRSSIQKQYAKKYFRQQLREEGVPEEVIDGLTRSFMEMASFAEILDQSMRKHPTSKGENPSL